MSETYTCAMCKREFETDRPESESIDELHQQFGEDISPTDCDVVCDGCWEKIRPDRNEAEFAAWEKVYEILNRADEIFRSLFQEFIECDEARILQGEGVGEPIGILSQSDIVGYKEEGQNEREKRRRKR